MAATRSRVDRRSDALLLVDADTDPAAFAELYRRHAASVFRWLERRMGWLAADLTAETFTRAWLQRGRFSDQREGSALPWLLGIAGRLVADAARHDRVETRARERLGLTTELVSDDGYDEVERRLSPRSIVERRLAGSGTSCSAQSCANSRPPSGRRRCVTASGGGGSCSVPSPAARSPALRRSLPSWLAAGRASRSQTHKCCGLPRSCCPTPRPTRSCTSQSRRRDARREARHRQQCRADRQR